jgi:Ca2+-transporting ATPase
MRAFLRKMGHFATASGAVSLTFMLQIATIYIPFLQGILKTTSLSAVELLICVTVSFSVFAAVEVEKLFVRKRWLKF